MATPDKPLEHACEVCGKPASWGYGVALLKDKSGKWYCYEHRPDPLQG